MLSNKYNNEDSFLSSDSDDYQEVFYSSSSHDRSSVGSIPWAEDAIKQNQLEWERLERMFYGEEKLPDDDDLRNEIIEWNKMFPHLRVIGRKIDVTQFENDLELYKPQDVKEDIIIVHPSKQHSYTSYPHYETTSARSLKQVKSGADDLIQLLEKDLRISSVPMLRRKQDKTAKSFTIISSNKSALQKHHPTSTIRHFMPSKSSGTLFHHKAVKSGSAIKTSNSASFLRMPPILNIIVPHNAFLAQPAQIYIAERKPRNAVMLPAINLHKRDYSPETAARSISAISNQKQIAATYLPYSASKLKFSK